MNNSYTSSVTRIPLLGVIMPLLLACFPAHAETTNCTAITSLPAVITTQGVYCFTGNLSTSMTSGNAIEIQTNNVTIDLNGFKLGGLGARDGTQANGIYADQRKNITIKNGIIRGFYRGIWLDAPSFATSSGQVVKNVLADQNTFTGIDVRGFGNTVSGNTVVDTGGSTVINDAIGIWVLGSGAKVVNNTVSTTTATGTGIAIGISLFSADYSLVQNNTVTDTLDNSTNSYAIYIADDSTGVFVRDNNMANADLGLFFLFLPPSSSGKYKDNLTFNVTTPFSGGINAGGNN